jgi:8-oxo-dGTP pyrophosphatase MutT (NUDIX family)
MTTITNREISCTVGGYLAVNDAERDHLVPLLSSLANDGRLTSRATVPGHVTCSAAVLNGDGCVLMIRHVALDRWLLPGGHLDPADLELPAGARRELAEETGIRAREVSELPIDIDVHQIPASPIKGEPPHWHADFRYTFFVTDPAVVLQAEEVSSHAWKPSSALPTVRLADKVARLARERARGLR